MSTYFTESEEFTRRARVAEGSHHRLPRVARPRTRTRVRVARNLRRVADRLEQ